MICQRLTILHPEIFDSITLLSTHSGGLLSISRNGLFVPVLYLTYNYEKMIKYYLFSSTDLHVPRDIDMNKIVQFTLFSILKQGYAICLHYVDIIELRSINNNNM